MRKSFLSLVPLVGAILVSCSSNRFEEHNIRDAFFDWGVTNNTTLFGEYDSLYYLINPIGNIFDSIYYNGNYTDSYYKADSLRVSMAYTTQDSVKFYFDRMYAVQTNPAHLLLTVFTKEDSIKDKCTFQLDRMPNNENVFACKANSELIKFLRYEGQLNFSATNCSSTAEPQGSQNYEFTLNAIGFMQAYSEALALNPQTPISTADSATQDTLPTDTLPKESLPTDKEKAKQHNPR